MSEHFTFVFSGPFLVSTPAIVDTFTDPTPGAETIFVFPSGVKRFEVGNRGTKAVKVAFVSAQPTQTRTLNPSATYEEDTLSGGGLSLYFTSAFASQKLEIVYWT